MALAVEGTDDKQADGCYSYPLVSEKQEVEVRLARSLGGDEVSVIVNGPLTPELGLRPDTLLSAFATG